MSFGRSAGRSRPPLAGLKKHKPRVEPMEARQLLATFLVSSVGDSGPNTLRQAILDANAAPGQNDIRFGIPGPGPFSIAPLTALPAITNTVIIDGTTQPGFAGRPIVELNGAGVVSTTRVNGLSINAPNSTVKGLVINRFGSYGIAVGGVSGGTIAGNFLGTDRTGTVALGNQAGGVLVADSTAVTIGGRSPADRNLISGNRGDGIDLLSSSGLASNNLVLGNAIGTDPSGTRSLPNFGSGVFVVSTGNVIGGAGAGEANTIAFNSLSGVRVGSFNTESGVTSNAIRGNAIFANNGLGIDLGSAGVAFNGTFGTGFGPNRLQPFPVINSAFPSGGGTRVEGRLEGTSNSTFAIDLYANDLADPSGFGEGQRYLGSTTVTTDDSGVSNFEATLATAVPSGQVITATATDLDNNTSEFSRARSVTPSAVLDLSVNIFVDPNPVIIGSDLTYDVFVTNNGPSLATNLTITDTLPANVTFVSATSNGRSSTAVNGVVTANVGDLRSGETASLRIVVRPNVVGLISNTARASADQADPADANNTATINTTVSPPVPADLLVASFASSTQATVGDEFMYTVVIANNGPSNEAAGVVLTDILPAGSTFVSATLSQGTFAVADNTLTATLGSLPRGANATVQLTVRLNVAGRATNRATVRGAQADPNFLNNTSTLETPVLPPAAADLAIFAGAQPEPARVGRPLTYSIIVSNRGPGDATGVVLTDELDPAVTLVSATASQGTASSDGSTVTANFGTLIVGQSVLVTIVVRPTAIGTLTNTASVRADQTDFNPTNNVVTTTSRVDEEANPPILLAQRLTVTRKAITGIVLTFSEPLDLIQAEALNNYRLVPSGKNGPSSAQQHSPIALASAVYNASRRTVTLTPQQPLPLGRFYQLTVNGRGASGTTDPTGNVLDGDRNGLPDGIYASILGRGTSVRPVQFQRDQNVPIPPPAGRLRSTPQGPARRLTKASSSVRTESLFTRTSVKQVNRTTT